MANFTIDKIIGDDETDAQAPAGAGASEKGVPQSSLPPGPSRRPPKKNARQPRNFGDFSDAEPEPVTARPAHAAATVAQVRARAADAAKKSASQIASRITKLLPQSVINPAPSQSGQGKSLARELLEAEKRYREGLTSLKDIIAPAAVRVNASEIELSGTFTRTYFLLAYPRYLSSNWLAPVINMDIPMDISMFIYAMDGAQILKKLRDKVGQIQSNITLAQEKGDVRDPMLETALHDAEELRDRLVQGTERYFRFSIYFTLYAATIADLNKHSTQLETVLGSKLVVVKRAFLQMKQGLNSTLPIGQDDLAVANNLNTEPLSSTFPFVSSDLTTNEGILYGINLHNNSLILFDRFSMENANLVCFAKSGAGKSYLVKLEILRSMMMGTSVIVVDPESEYKHLAGSVSGVYLNVSLNSDYRVNPFELPKGIEGEKDEDILRSAIVNLLGLMNILLGKMDGNEESIMERALWETYAKKDITPEVGIGGREMPVMDDLVEILQGIEGGENLASRLYKFTKGTFAGLFNQPTNVELNNQLVCFSIRDLEDALRPAAVYVILNFIWNEVRSELKRRILVIDEAWWMMQHADSAVFLANMAKRSRKYYLGVTTITQDVTDFLQSPHGEPIINNSSIQILLKQAPNAIELLSKVFFLTEGEKYLLLESEVGEGLFFAGLKHVAIKVVASYVEDQIITTDPRQILQIQEAKREIDQQQ
ncbi:MAG TPA: ATP-binding protein [Patescibacteria group bacterium]|nr:ATP-binding protein [Patescibacteria group bacterium]